MGTEPSTPSVSTVFLLTNLLLVHTRIALVQSDQLIVSARRGCDGARSLVA